MLNSYSISGGTMTANNELEIKENDTGVRIIVSKNGISAEGKKSFYQSKCIFSVNLKQTSSAPEAYSIYFDYVSPVSLDRYLEDTKRKHLRSEVLLIKNISDSEAAEYIQDEIAELLNIEKKNNIIKTEVKEPEDDIKEPEDKEQKKDILESIKMRSREEKLEAIAESEFRSSEGHLDIPFYSGTESVTPKKKRLSLNAMMFSAERILSDISLKNFDVPDNFKLKCVPEEGYITVLREKPYEAGFKADTEKVVFYDGEKESVIKKKDIIQLYCDETPVEIIKGIDDHGNDAYTAKEIDKKDAVGNVSKHRIFNLSIFYLDKDGKESKQVVLSSFRPEDPSAANKTFRLDSDLKIPPLYFFRYIEQEAEKILGIADEPVDGESFYDMKKGEDAAHLPEYIEYINTGSSREFITKCGIKAYIKTAACIFCLAAFACLGFMALEVENILLGIVSIGMIASMFFALWSFVLKMDRDSAHFKEHEIIFSRKNLIGWSNILFKGEYSKIKNIFSFEKPNDRKRRFCIKTEFDDGKEISIFNGITAEQAEFMVDRMNEFLHIRYW
ncbi:MAG: hypothetical protein MJ234_02000 [bacterium]|nr:hypothetical protein [bacterium]